MKGPRGKARDRRKFIILIGPRDRRLSTALRATWGRHQGGQKAGVRKRFRREPLSEFPKERQSRAG